MAIETVGSTQALQQLIAIYYTKYNQHPTVWELWRPIERFISSHRSEGCGVFASYKIARVDGRGNNLTFLADINELIRKGFVEVREGCLATTSTGYCIAAARTLPQRVAHLANEV